MILHESRASIKMLETTPTLNALKIKIMCGDPKFFQ